MAAVNLGELETLVELQSVTKALDARGGVTDTWTTYAQVYAKVDRSVTEGVDDYNHEASSALTLTIYKVPALTTRWRVKIGTKVYEIRGISPISRISDFCELTLYAIDG